MVTTAQMQRGMVNFIDREVLPHLSGYEKLVVGAGTSLIATKLPNVMDNLSHHPVLAALDLYKDGQVDIDAVYNAVKPYIGTEQISVKVPVVGITLRMGQREIADLYRYIKEA